MSDLPVRLEKLRIRDLLLLEYIQDCGSLRQVAERLHVTQPAVTLALQVIEDAFGVALVQRGRRGVTLTATGQAVLRRLTVGRKELAAAYAAAMEPDAPHVRLGCSPVAAMDLVPAVLGEFFRSLGERRARVTITESSVPGLWTLLHQGDLDAIVCRMPHAGQMDLLRSGLVCEMVGAERLVLVAPRDSMLARPGPLDLELLSRQSWVLPPKDSVAHLVLSEWLVTAGVPAPVSTVTSSSFHTSLMLAAAAGMVTLAPESAARGLAAGLGLCIIETGNAWGATPMVFAHRASSLHLPELALLKRCFSDAAGSRTGEG